MERLVYYLKNFFVKHFEPILIIVLIAFAVLANFLTEKLAFLNFYYLPVLVAGYILGKRHAVMTGFFSILLETLRLIFLPSSFLDDQRTTLTVTLSIITWGSFLILVAYVVGILYEEKEKKIQALRTAYIGVIEILTKYIESVDRYTKGHSVRVADLSLEIAIALGLVRNECENIRVAGLLHDVGKIEVSTDLIKKAAELTVNEKDDMATHSEKGGNLLSKVGDVLKEAIPLVIAHHEYFCKGKDAGSKDMGEIPLGARIIAVADAYDAIVTDRPYRKGKPPWQALEVIKESAGKQFDPAVVEAFSHVLSKFIDRDEREEIAAH